MRQIIFTLILVSFVFISCKENKTTSDSTATATDMPSADVTSTATAPTVAPQENMTNSTPAAPPVAAPVTNTATPTPQPAAAPATAQKEPAQNAKGVWHFTCPKGCKGGGGASGPCSKCGTTLAHNAAYHDAAAPAAQSVVNGPQANGAPTIAPLNQPAAKPEPAQNAKGVWHFTCAKGCEGGAGAAGNCAKCGGALAHNAVYHQ